MQSSATNTIFTDDLKSVIHIAESDEDLAVLEKMIARLVCCTFNSPNVSKADLAF